MGQTRLDQALARQGMVATRSQAESYIKLGKVKVNGKLVSKPGALVGDKDQLELVQDEQYVSRAALKLASVTDKLGLNFTEATVLDVGSSTGGFTYFALRHGAKKVIAVDVGTEQLHPSLRLDSRVELMEKTDIRQVVQLPHKIDIVLADLSFISLRKILPTIAKLSNFSTQIIVMAKPQFEASITEVSRGVIKNDSIRRKVLKDLEIWLKSYFIVEAKADSEVKGAKGNLERFYRLKKLAQTKH